MKHFFTLFALFAISSCAVMAQDQILNGGFEDWGKYDVKTTSAAEPRYWHSFSSASGGFAFAAGEHCFISTDAHSGKYSACLKSTKILKYVANGTLTTGRLNAGDMNASSKLNHSALDMSWEDTDFNGDPFYQVMTSRPDSIVFWVKYSTGEAGTTANMSAYITDGKYYQVPEDKTYNNIVGKAENPKITPCTKWTRISVPFTYTDNGLEPKAILLTFSTSAIPGVGSKNDILYVDDVELIYNVKGDVNSDGNVDISDVVELVNIILGSKDGAENKRADVNGDTNTDISDVVELVNIILGN